MKKFIAPSMMCADFMHMEEQMNEMNKLEIDMLHIDVMDGNFVPNYSLFPDIVKMMRASSDLPFDYHFMVENPEHKLKWFDIRKDDYVSVHIECDEDTGIALDAIKALGAKAGVALKPLTSIEIIEPYLDKIDFLVIMTVNPGFAGQTLIPETLEKISCAKAFFKKTGHENILIEVDGNVGFENGKKMSAKGADIFVAGSSGFFRKDMSMDKALATLRNAIEEELPHVD